MIDIQKDELLTLPEAARLVPSINSDKPVHPLTLSRWANQGLKGVRLEVVRIGIKPFTTLSAIERFVREVTAVIDGSGAPTTEQAS